jgi:hypothetical protein
MPATIYSTKSALVKRIREIAADQKAELVRSQDPSFRAFVDEVDHVAASYHREGPAEYNLFRLWFISRTFREHWSAATKDTMRHMAWVCYLHRLSKFEAGWVILAWMYRHGRRPSQDELHNELTKTINKVWNDVQPELEKERRKRNAKRRERYNKMKKGTKRSTPKRDRIIEELKQGRSTPDKLAVDLGLTVDSVQSHLSRMVRDGAVVRVGHGLYELTSGTPVIEKTEPQPVPSPVFTTDDLSDGCADYQEPASYEYIEPDADEPEEEMVLTGSELPTAEPRFR